MPLSRLKTPTSIHVLTVPPPYIHTTPPTTQQNAGAAFRQTDGRTDGWAGGSDLGLDDAREPSRARMGWMEWTGDGEASGRAGVFLFCFVFLGWFVHYYCC